MEIDMTVGKYLQKKREVQQISLEEVSKVTRIKPEYLHALEEDAFHLLPAETYTCGFLSNYARCINLDPAEILNLYHRQHQPQTPEPPKNKTKINFYTSFLKYLFNFTLSLLLTIAGASPAFSLGKSFLPPKH